MRDFADRERLAEVVRAGLGSDRRVDGLTRLRGGTKKGVYRLTLDDRSTVVGYVWSADENYWPARPGTTGDESSEGGDELSQGGDEPSDGALADASDSELFAAANAELVAAGVRTPEILLLDRSRSRFPADVALVEDVPGPNLERRLATDPTAVAGTVTRLAEALTAMHGRQGTRPGKVATLARSAGPAPAQRSAVDVVLDRALGDLAEAAGRDDRLARDRVRLTELLRGLADGIAPRPTYGLIHGELGPDHVLVDGDGAPVLIDIEGLMYFDVEWEHVFLRLRFGVHYHPLAVDGLDERRLRLYRLAQHLSLVAGPLRLLDGDFPDRDVMRGIAAYHTERALSFPD
ncbi:phosphotransferase family protein [Plantactinospora endophytica]|uniref:Aminoglycoside phosphotransferase n=1 Tax=Plantactinospora endophytica TaxID=673535 RepID=A0ABQ4E2Z2_9ACTN|nr:phosphotransferase [Plantactinospora endophytica]GIG89051.1 aminoglycoside phosphotransferase [Plantactinospora endophytica]